MKKIISMILVAMMILSSVTISMAAEEAETDSKMVKIIASSDEPITINASDEEVNDQGIFASGRYNLYVNRDYEQNRTITVRNSAAAETTRFYLECGQYSDDLAINFIKGGSKDEPILLKPGEEKEITLSIFTQNAQKKQYEFEIFAYQNIEGKEQKTSKALVVLNVDINELDLSVDMTNEDQYTMAQTYSVRNNSYNTITDLKISLSDELSKYAYMREIINHTELQSYDSVEFSVAPNLQSMLADNVTTFSGDVIISGMGSEQTLPVTFDVTGKEIISTSLNNLALIQNGNELINLKQDDDSFKIHNNYSATGTDSVSGLSFDMLYGQNDENVINTDFNMETRALAAGESDESLQGIQVIDEYGKVSIVSTIVVPIEGFADIAQAASETGDEVDKLVETITLSFESKDDAILQDFITKLNEALTDAKEYIATVDCPDVDDDVKADYLAYMTMRYIFDIVFPENNGEITYPEGYETIIRTILAAMFSGKDPSSLPKTMVDSYIIALKEKYKTISDDLKSKIDETVNKYKDKYKDGNEVKIPNKTDRECTNVGKVTSEISRPAFVNSAAVADVSAADAENFEIYYTGRFHGGGYVNYEPINYKYYLNGEVIATGSNNGLTELDVMKLPSDKFKVGEKNTFVREYDTNPGTHYVTKENEFTFIYPEDYIIDYVGEPDTLPDVRLKPDYACYDENIFVENEAVIGRANKIKVNYYNRGSQAGFYTMNLYINNELVNSSNGFMESFSINQQEFDWTPTVENNEIRVELINTSEAQEEYASDNNIAVSKVNARETQIPSIISLEPSEDTEQSNEVYLSADIENNADVTNVEFYLDDKKVDADAENSGTEYWVTTDIQILGKHTVEVKVTDYNNSQYSLKNEFNIVEAKNKYIGYEFSYDSSEIYAVKDTEFDIEDYIYVLAPVEGEENTYSRKELSDFTNDLTVQSDETGGLVQNSDNKFKFTPKETGLQLLTLKLGINTLEIYVRTFDEPCKIATYDIDFGEKSYPNVTVYQKNEENNWGWAYEYNLLYSKDRKTVNVILTPENFTAAENYIIVIKDYMGNSAVVPFIEGTTTVTTNDNAKLTFAENDKIEVYSVRATLMLGDNEMSTIYSSTKIDGEIKLPKQKYSLEISFGYDGEYYSVEFVEDMTEGDKEIDLVSKLNIVNVELGYESPSENPYIVLAGQYGSEYVNTIKVDDKNYNIVISNYILENIGNYNIYVIDNNSLYFAPLTKDNVKITATDFGILSFKKDEKTQINSLFIKSIGDNYIELPVDGDMKKPFNLPKGKYNISVQYVNDGVNLAVETTADLTNGNCEIDLNGFSKETNCIFGWSDTYGDTGYINLWGNDVDYSASAEYPNNTGRTLDNGNYTWSAYLYNGDWTYEMDGNFVITDDKGADVKIGNEYNGSIKSAYNRSSYTGNSMYSFTLNNLVDNDGNRLISCENYRNNKKLKGQLILTNTEDPKDVHISDMEFNRLYTNDYYSSETYSVKLPNVNGTYNVQLLIDGISVNPPTASVESGEYSGSITVQLISDYENAEIYYTLDGSEPTTSSSKYKDAIKINRSCTLRAIAVVDGDISPIASYEYIIKNSSTPGTIGGGGGSSFGVQRYTITVSYVNESGAEVGTSKVTLQSGSTLTNTDLVLPEGYELAEEVNYNVNKNDTITVKVKKTSEKATEIAFINGYEDGTFKPDNNISRAEVATLIYNLFGENQQSDNIVLDRFSDIPISHWGRNAIAYNVGKGYLKGDAGSDTFRPDSGMTRAELAQMLTNIGIQKNDVTADVVFSDIEGHWGRNAIEIMAKCGVINGYGDGTFRPDDQVTRAEAVTMISRLLNRSADWNGNKSFSDVHSDFWAYNIIMNAVNGK